MMEMEMNNINPLGVYKWLVKNRPSNPKEAAEWIKLAESAKIYCKIPIYAQMGLKQLRELERVADEFGLHIEDHVDIFNKENIRIENTFNKLIK